MKIFKFMQQLRAINGSFFEYKLIDEGLSTEHIEAELVLCGGIFTAYFQLMEDTFDIDLYAESKIGAFYEVLYERSDDIVAYINSIIQ